MQLLKHPISQKIHNFLQSPNLYLCMIGFGIMVRLSQYLSNRSLWADEAVLALNVINRSYVDLIKPLDYDQVAPIGFLWLEKLASQVLGDHEYAWRFFPFLGSIASIFLFAKLAQITLVKSASVKIALALFATLHILVYYAAEAKQYATDVMFAILACLVLTNINHSKLTIKNIIIYSIFGAGLIWLSHPIVFTLGAIGISCLLGCFPRSPLAPSSPEPSSPEQIAKNAPLSRQIEITKIIKQLIIYTVWLANFATFYLMNTVDPKTKEGLVKSWQTNKAFPKSWLDLGWLWKSFVKFFHKPLGFPDIFTWLVMICLILGCVSLYLRYGKNVTSSRQERADQDDHHYQTFSLWERGWGKGQILCLLLGPLMFAIVAAYLYKYPFQGRLLLFLIPYFILLIAEGANFFRLYLQGKKGGSIASILVLIMLVVPPVGTAAYLTIFPYSKQDIKPVIAYIKNHQQPGDVLYVYQRGQNLFEYYAPKYGYHQGDYIMGVDDLDAIDGKGMSDAEVIRYKNDLDQLKGKSRVWILLAHVDHVKSETKMIKSYLDQIGKKIDTVTAKDAYGYLYDFRSK